MGMLNIPLKIQNYLKMSHNFFWIMLDLITERRMIGGQVHLWTHLHFLNPKFLNLFKNL